MRRGLWFVALSLLVLLALGFVASESLGETLLEDLRRQPAWAMSMVLVGLAALAFLIARIVRQARHASLQVDSDGIRCKPHPHHGSRRWLRRDWALPWSAIRRAVVQRPSARAQHLQHWINVTLTLETDAGDYSMPLLRWEPKDRALDRPELTAFRPGPRLHALTESHPLLEHFRRRGIEPVFRSLDWHGAGGPDRPAEPGSDASGARGPVDLMDYPSLVAMLALIGLLAVLAALHFTVLPPIRALWPPVWGAIALAGSLAFAVAALAPTAAPIRERTVLALLLGVAVAGSWHPLSARALAVLGEPASRVDYVVEGSGRFVPIEPGYPEVDLGDLDLSEYWRSLERGQPYPLELQAVDGDRWILRLDPLFERTRAFYQGR